jgi:multiple sugar transport system ATP-binding protein
MELLGDATMITVRVNRELVSVKAAKDYRARIGEMVRISVPKEICHLFDPKTGARIGG